MTLTALEIALGVAALVAIVTIIVIVIRRGGSATLPAPLRLFLRITLGIIFIILGIIGGLLPVLQGWIFILLALLILFPESKFAIKAVDKIERRMPRVVRWLHRMGIGVHRH